MLQERLHEVICGAEVVIGWCEQRIDYEQIGVSLDSMRRRHPSRQRYERSRE